MCFGTCKNLQTRAVWYQPDTFISAHTLIHISINIFVPAGSEQQSVIQETQKKMDDVNAAVNVSVFNHFEGLFI